ncbi:MAG: GC-type dockerin domain-anchored protein [Planctomycetota bacterium]
MAPRLTAVIVLCCGGAALGQFWTTPVGQGLMEGISDAGVAVGSFNHPAGEYFLWTEDGGVELIGGVPAGSGVGGQAKISNDGRYVCGTIFNDGPGWHEMARYDRTTGEWTPLGFIPGFGEPVDDEISSGWNISGDGRSVVGLGWTLLGTADAHAMQWTEGVGVIDLGTAAIGTSARASAVDLDGNVVAGWQDGAGRQGAVWVDGVQELISTDAGRPALEAFGVSDDGRYVVGFGIGAPGVAYRYNVDTDEYQPLPSPPAAQRNTAATSTTADGSIVVGGTWPLGPATFGRGFVWQEGVGTTAVEDFLDASGVAYPPGFVFSFVASISPSGEWMTGWGYEGSIANSQSWIVRLAGCVADFDGDGELTLFDFLAFQNAFDAGEPRADIDGDGVLTLFDFLAFQNAFDGGCP